MKKYLALLVAVAMLICAFAGCSAKEDGSTTNFNDGYPEMYLRVSMGDDMSTADVMMTTGDYMIPLNIYNTLVECDLDFGFNWTVHPRVQLDLYGMFNCQDPKSYNDVGLGVAWLIN